MPFAFESLSSTDPSSCRSHWPHNPQPTQRSVYTYKYQIMVSVHWGNQIFWPNTGSFCYIWESYIAHDIQIGRSRLEIVVEFEGISLGLHSKLCNCAKFYEHYIVCVDPGFSVDFPKVTAVSHLRKRNNLLQFGSKLLYILTCFMDFPKVQQCFAWVKRKTGLFASIWESNKEQFASFGCKFHMFCGLWKVFLIPDRETKQNQC